uniref:SLAIN motif-containing protein 2-like isoform X2 n=1 Tax=Doryrhamphus excisus TaxID=161450 RepID=UPI0025ADC775|nr:SLAIN motif-containing protein 2-like isoform X2 [Doryrhamphus excisus]
MCARRVQMEAALLKPNIVPGVDCNSNPVSGDLQVRRLQELVLRLEFHNEQLRTRAGAGRHCCPLASPLASRMPQEDAGVDLQQPDGSVLSVLDEVELLDVDLDCSDETWLYMSTKASKVESTITPLQWCRQVLDDPEWEVIKRSMRFRLKSASCWCRSLSSPVSSPPPPSRVGGVSPIGTPCAPVSSSETHASSLRHHQSSVSKARIPTFIPHLARGSSLRHRSPRPRVDSDIISPRVDEDESVTHDYKLQDLIDVQVVARLQEENLRAHRYFSFINPTRCVFVCHAVPCHAIPHVPLIQDSGRTTPACPGQTWPTDAARASPSHSAHAPTRRRETRGPTKTSVPCQLSSTSPRRLTATPSSAAETGEEAAASCPPLLPRCLAHPLGSPTTRRLGDVRHREQIICEGACLTSLELPVIPAFPVLACFITAKALIPRVA